MIMKVKIGEVVILHVSNFKFRSKQGELQRKQYNKKFVFELDKLFVITNNVFYADKI